MSTYTVKWSVKSWAAVDFNLVPRNSLSNAAINLFLIAWPWMGEDGLVQKEAQWRLFLTATTLSRMFKEWQTFAMEALSGI